MDKLERKLLMGTLKQNKWVILFFIIVFILLLYSRLDLLEPRVSVPCTIVSKGVSFTHIGNDPEVRCELSDGYQKVVKISNVGTHKIGDIIYVSVRKSDTL